MTRAMIERQIKLTRRNLINALACNNTETVENLQADFKNLWTMLDNLS